MTAFRAYMKAANSTSGSNDNRHLSEAQVIAYCRGEMSGVEHDDAEAHLVSCEQCLAMFRNARDFLEPAGDDEAEITAAETDAAWNSLWQNIPRNETATVVSGDFQRSREKTLLSRAALPLAACLLLSLGAFGWQTWRLLSERRSRQQSQELAAQLESRQRELEQRLSQLERSGKDELQQEREQRLALEAERDQLEARLAQLGHESEVVPVYTARLSSERGAEDDVRVRFSGATKAARLRLLISKPYEFPEYTVEFVDESGRVVMKTAGVRPGGDEGALSVQIKRLNAGKYKLRLFGGKERKPLGEYGVLLTTAR